jgi:ATP-dependent Lon protease
MNCQEVHTNISNQNIVITPEMFMKILNEREEMMKIIKSLSETKTSNSVIAQTINDNSTNNSNNNTFNMNLFLNEKCKDAMNMKDFVNSIQLNMTDLENVGRLGYVEGMSNIFIDNLQKTDLYKRPVHCSDVKRETLYVKEDNQWAREGPDHAKMTNAVLAVEQKNVALVNEWAKANPRCMNSNTRENETYFRLSKAATDGEKDGNIDKVIRKVAKKVVIEKEPLLHL